MEAWLVAVIAVLVVVVLAAALWWLRRRRTGTVLSVRPNGTVRRRRP